MTMVAWIAGLSGVVLLVASGRVWLDFTRLAERLSAHIVDLRLKIEEHGRRLEETRQRGQDLKAQIETVTEECNELETEVRGLDEELAEVRNRLERVRPQGHQVDRDDKGDWKWKR